jgi:putative MATE family efflux protein
VTEPPVGDPTSDAVTGPAAGGRARPWRRSAWDAEIARLAVPAFGALIAEPLYLLADTAVVGHLGTPQLAGLAVAGQALTTTYAIFIFLAYGTTAAVARLLGAGEDGEAGRQAVQSIWLALAVSAVLVPVGVVAAGPLVRAIGADGAAAGYAETYLRISALGIPAMLVIYAATGYLRGLQDTRTPLLLAAGSAVVNLVLEVVLVYGLGYGIGASAAATVATQYGAVTVYAVMVGRSAVRLRVPLRPDPRAVRRLAQVGFALFIRTSSLYVVYTLATTVAARLGPAEVGAHQVAMQVFITIALGLDAIAIAGQALTGRLLGAGDAVAARAATRRMIELGLGAGLGAAAVVLATCTVLPHVFTSDPAVLHLATFLLLFVAVQEPAGGIVFVLDGILIGAGDMRFLAWAMAGAAALFLAAGIVLLVAHAGIGWLWAALTAFTLARLAALGVRARGDAWMVLGATR